MAPISRNVAGVLLGLFLILFGAAAQATPVPFAMKDVNGKSHSVAAEHGHWLVVNVWATWCPPCRRELPELAKFAKAHRHGSIRIWGLSVDQERSAAELSMFAEDHGLDYPIFKVPPREVGLFGQTPGIPTTFLLNPQGEVVARHVGAITIDELTQMIARQKRQAKS